jgi:ribosome maturation factor RimP
MNLDKIRATAERVARSAGMEIFDLEWKVGKERFLRVYLDRPPRPDNPGEAGISHQDCELVSHQLSVILDVEELVPGPAYILEVSSPGLDRKLRHAGDYERFTGRPASLWLAEPVENSRHWEGRLVGCADGIVKLAVRERVLDIGLANIRKANLVVEV